MKLTLGKKGKKGLIMKSNSILYYYEGQSDRNLKPIKLLCGWLARTIKQKEGIMEIGNKEWSVTISADGSEPVTVRNNH